MRFTIFYSWQSDLPNNTNRGFIETVLEKAVKNIGSDLNFDIEPTVDRDTQGVPGSPNISQTIIDKIKSCDVFVADISIVTGVKEQGQRLSPNPNVLLELGYAISSLGWEKIILFHNELYGSDEDLPFDIRQHRRITYTLKPEDEKQPSRDSLSATCRSRLIEIIQNSTFASKTKRPVLIPSWNFLGIEIEGGALKDISSTKLELRRPASIEKIKTSLETSMQQVRAVDGSIDPKWSRKVSAFMDNCAQFLERLENKEDREIYLLKSNAGLSMSVTISVTNNGTSPATDIRANAIVPDSIILSEKLPEGSDIPVAPRVPIPEAPRIDTGFREAIASIAPNSFRHGDLLASLHPLKARTNGFYVKGKELTFWADRLLHKHTIKPTDRIYMLANPDCKSGIYEVVCRMFCVEYEDWEEHVLLIEIK